MRSAFFIIVALTLAANGLGCACHRKCGNFCGHPGHCTNCGGCGTCGTACSCAGGPCCDAGCGGHCRGGLLPRGGNCCTPRGGLFEYWWGHHGGGHGGAVDPYADPYAGQMQAAPPQSAGAVAYPYYTTRGPRDFLINNPPSIGPY
jgi:hypothetical protein